MKYLLWVNNRIKKSLQAQALSTIGDLVYSSPLINTGELPSVMINLAFGEVEISLSTSRLFHFILPSVIPSLRMF